MRAKPIIQDTTLKLRAPEIVMDLERLGCFHSYALSFMRILIRRILSQDWKFTRARFELDDQGYGDVVYEIQTPENLFSLVVFSQYLDPDIRSDRVIAEAWDVTMVLRSGKVGNDTLERLRANVPLQEKGRVDSDCIVLSRANKSARNFEYVLDKLIQGQQPDIEPIAKVGYLYRTTAVYGSGKFGMGDWKIVSQRFPELATPFTAEMLVCFLIRQFSFDRLHHLARCKAPATYVELAPDIQRYIGIGNATGLGMAPYLINHPLLIARWIEVRETALARVVAMGVPAPEKRRRFMRLAKRACCHLAEIDTDNTEQNGRNKNARTSLEDGLAHMITGEFHWETWGELQTYATGQLSMECQEIIHSLLIECYVDEVMDLENLLTLEETYTLKPAMKLSELNAIIETSYNWALAVDFSAPQEMAKFWYKSEEKMEPRLGTRFEEPGADKEIFLGMAKNIRDCHDDVMTLLHDSPNMSVGSFVMKHPVHRFITRRMQTMSETVYGEIRANVLHENILPIHLLRCKLSFFGVSKFDPRSRLWVRNTMFQGAPLMDELGGACVDDWAFPMRAAYDAGS